MALHTVVIDSKLKPIEMTFKSIQSEKSVEEHWLHEIKEDFDELEYNSNNINKSLYTVANGPYTEKSSNAVLEAFLWAYHRHHDIVLSPDDMWLLVCMYFAEYMNKNTEEYQSIFLEQEKGKILLKISYSENENNWDEFFHTIKSTIVKNTKNNIGQLLSSVNFSTTGKIESILSTTCIMHVFEPYFDYENITDACGIRRVHFMGTLNDWQCLRDKTQQLKSFSNDKFHEYIDGILPIFDQFIETYKGNVNRWFWNKICDIKLEESMESNSHVPIHTENLTGWLAQLFGMQKNILAENHPSHIGLPCINVPVELIKSSTNTKTLCHMIGGFHGIYSIENRYKPVMSLSVIEEIKLST